MFINCVYINNEYTNLVYLRHKRIRVEVTSCWYVCNFCLVSLSLYRDIQLPSGWPLIQAGIQLLLNSNLHPLLHACHRIMGVILVGSECRPGTSIAGSHNSSHNGNSNLRNQPNPATCLLHKGSWCVDRGLPNFRVWCPPRVCTRQLRFPVWPTPGKCEEAASTVGARTGRCPRSGCCRRRWPLRGWQYSFWHGKPISFSKHSIYY